MESSRRHLWQIWRPKSLKSILSRNLGCSEERQHDFSVVTSSRRNMSIQAWSKRYAQYVQSTVCDAVSFFAFGETTFGEPREHKPFLENFLFVLTWLQSLKTFLAEINPGWLNRLQDGSRSTEAHSYGKNLRWQECGEGVLFWWTASTCSNLCYALNYFTCFLLRSYDRRLSKRTPARNNAVFLALSRNSRSMNSIKPACFRMWASKRANSLLSWLPRQDARGWHNVDCGWLEIMRDLHGPLPLQQHWTFNSLSLHSFLLNSPPSIGIRAWRVSAHCVDYSSLTACQLRNLTDHLLLQRSKAKPPAAPAAAPATTPTPAPAPTAGWVQWPEKSEIGQTRRHHFLDSLGRAEKYSNTDLTVAGCRLTCNLSAGAAPGVDTGAVGKPKDASTSVRVCWKYLKVLFNFKWLAILTKSPETSIFLQKWAALWKKTAFRSGTFVMDGIVANLNKSKSLVYTRSKGIQGLVEPFQKTKTAAATVVSGGCSWSVCSWEGNTFQWLLTFPNIPLFRGCFHIFRCMLPFEMFADLISMAWIFCVPKDCDPADGDGIREGTSGALFAGASAWLSSLEALGRFSKL